MLCPTVAPLKKTALLLGLNVPALLQFPANLKSLFKFKIDAEPEFIKFEARLEIPLELNVPVFVTAPVKLAVELVVKVPALLVVPFTFRISPAVNEPDVMVRIPVKPLAPTAP